MKPEMVPLLRKGVEWVEEQEPLRDAGQPHEWEQGGWVTATRTPDRAIEGTDLRLTSPCGSFRCLFGYLGSLLDPAYTKLTVVRGVHVADFVTREFGFTGIERCNLAGANNTADTIRQHAENIAGQRL
jgi:hypothetical protein